MTADATAANDLARVKTIRWEIWVGHRSPDGPLIDRFAESTVDISRAENFNLRAGQ